MRKEADLSQWKELYETATRIKEMKPWEKFWDMDLIAVGADMPENTTFFSILGRGNECYGVAVYEGYEAFNSFLMLTMQERLNLSAEYAMFNQRNLTCYWGNREELTEKQRKIIKELGYRYRGKNQWLYFLSFEPGYYPYQLDQDEVIRMTEHFQNLERALKAYEERNIQVNFQDANMFYLEFNDKKEVKTAEERPLPFSSFEFGSLEIMDEELLDDLGRAPQSNIVLEADICMLGSGVHDKKYDRPANPPMCLVGEASTGLILKYEMLEPEEDAVVSLAEEIIGFILAHGAPKEIRVSNVIVEAGLEHICKTCGMKLRRLKRLAGLDEFRESMKRFGM